MWWKTAKPGDKIVCVSQPVEWDVSPPKTPLVVGAVYVIRDIVVDEWFSTGVGFYVGTHIKTGGRSYIDAARFRPVQPTHSKRTTKTGMRIFTDLLDTTPVRKHEKEDV